jgi:hypothetical protein
MPIAVLLGNWGATIIVVVSDELVDTATENDSISQTVTVSDTRVGSVTISEE